MPTCAIRNLFRPPAWKGLLAEVEIQRWLRRKSQRVLIDG